MNYPVIHKAIEELAARCDGAATEDGKGFNKPDSYLGKRLAATPAALWTPAHYRQAWLMLQKYGGQLDLYGIDLASSEQPPEGESERLLGFENGRFQLVFPYDSQHVSEVKSAFSSRNFNYQRKTWSVSANEYADVQVFAKKHGYIITDDALLVFESPEAHLPKRGSTHRIDVRGQKFVIYFPYDRALVSAVKSLPQRKFDKSCPCWTAPFSAATSVVEFAKTHDFAISDAAQAAIADAPEPLPERRVEFSGGLFSVFFEYNPRFTHLVKKIPSVRFVESSPCWRAPLASAVEVESFANMNDFVLMESAENAIAAHIAQMRENLSASSAFSAELAPIEGLRGTLRPFQRAGVQYALKNKRVLIGDQMGLGKTVEALATIQAANAYPALIICPASLKLNWQREARKWLPDGTTIEVVNGRKAKHSADVTIINYDIVGRKAHKETLIGRRLRAVICDESHYIKNYKAKRTQHVTDICKSAEYRLLLSGTPMMNRPQELISQLKALGRLEDMGGFWNFGKRYCKARQTRYGWDFSGAANLGELNEKLRMNCYVRREKSDVLAELPAKQRAEMFLPLSNQREYSKAERDLITWLRKNATADKKFNQSIAKLSKEEQRKRRSERANEKEQRARRAEQLVRISTLKKLVAQGKMKAAIEWIESFTEAGEKLIVFGYHTEVCEQLAEHFSAPMIIGSTTQSNRQAAVDRFQNDDDCKIIVGNLQAMGVGLTLTAASNVAFMELGWTPAIHDQAEDRAHRIGQESRVTAWYLLAEHTIEDTISELIEQKREIVDAATAGSEGAGAQQNSVVKELAQRLMGGK